ncbi:MAG: hypothetical protein LBO66_04155 [Deltaproteobacteria bacterium]|jgi:hypothetical protein|nr:hypothetical protein [Deltaproteobacteria bacterium]
MDNKYPKTVKENRNDSAKTVLEKETDRRAAVLEREESNRGQVRRDNQAAATQARPASSFDKLSSFRNMPAKKLPATGAEADLSILSR